jgi:hypothetical protein
MLRGLHSDALQYLLKRLQGVLKGDITGKMGVGDNQSCEEAKECLGP